MRDGTGLGIYNKFPYLFFPCLRVVNVPENERGEAGRVECEVSQIECALQRPLRYSD